MHHVWRSGWSAGGSGAFHKIDGITGGKKVFVEKLNQDIKVSLHQPVCIYVK